MWCPDRTNVWVLRRVLRENPSTGEIFVSVDDTSEQRFLRTEVHPFDESHRLDLYDVAKVNNLHEAPLLDMLQRRYALDKIYTYAANVLISINPYKTIPYMYDVGDSPVEIDAEDPFPHLFTVSERAYQALRTPVTLVTQASRQAPRDQSVIVSGESGAGKTEASK